MDEDTWKVAALAANEVLTPHPDAHHVHVRHTRGDAEGVWWDAAYIIACYGPCGFHPHMLFSLN